MPIALLLTDMADDKVPKDFTDKFLHVYAEASGYPTETIQVMFLSGVKTSDGADPNGTHLRAILSSPKWPESEEENRPTCEKLTDFISKGIGIEPDNIIIILDKPKACMASIGGIMLPTLLAMGK